ncbi:MAG: DUF211 domain-containing protein, partial [Haloferacaceae archaeon]
MAPVLRLVLDVLKPHDPDLVAFAEAVDESDGVAGVDASLVETDREVENVILTIEGQDVRFEAVEEVVTDLGGSIHSVDEVA